MTLQNLTLNATGIGLIVAILAGLLKPWIGGTGAQKDSAVRSLVLVLAVAIEVANYVLTTAHPTGPGAEGVLGQGFVAAGAALAYYHTYNGDLQAMLGSLVGSQTPPAPPAPAPVASGLIVPTTTSTTGTATVTVEPTPPTA